MKNPEIEAISGFCCKLHFLSAEKEGLFSMIPRGEASNEKPAFATLIVFLFSSGLAQASLTRPSENKNPPTLKEE